MALSSKAIQSVFGGGSGYENVELDDEERRRRAFEDLAVKLEAIAGSGSADAYREAQGIAQGGGDHSILNTVLRTVSAPMSAATGVFKEASDWLVEHAPTHKVDGKEVSVLPVFAESPLQGVLRGIDALTHPDERSAADWFASPETPEGEKRTGSIEGFKEHFNKRAGYGDTIREADTSSGNQWVDRAAGFTGDVILDPLNLLAPQSSLARLGNRGVARLAAEVGEEGLTAKAFRGVSNLSDDELARISDKALEQGLINEPLRGGVYLGWGDNQLRIMGRNPATTGVARAFRGAEESIRKSGVGRYAASKSGDELKTTLTQLARRGGDPELETAAFHSLEGYGRGRIAGAGYHEQMERMIQEGLLDPDFADRTLMTKVLAGDDVSHTQRLLQEAGRPASADDAAQFLDKARKFDSQFVDAANHRIGDPDLLLPKREGHVYTTLSDELAEKIRGKGSVRQPTTFDPAGIETKAHIRAGGEFMDERLLPVSQAQSDRIFADDLAKLVDEGRLDPTLDWAELKAAAAKEGVEQLPVSLDDPITQANKIAKAKLGDEAVDLFDMDYFAAAQRASNITKKRVESKVLERHLREKGVAEPLWERVGMTPNAGEAAAGPLRRAASELRMERNIARRAAAVAKAEEQGLLERSLASTKAARQSVKGADEAVARAEALAFHARTQETALKTIQGKIDFTKQLGQEAQQAWEKGVDEAIVASETAMGVHGQQMRQTLQEWNDASRALDNVAQEVDDEILKATVRNELKGDAAKLQRKIDRAVKQRAPYTAKYERELAEVEARLSDQVGDVLGTGWTRETLDTARAELQTELDVLTNRYKDIATRRMQLRDVAEHHPDHANYLKLVEAEAKTVKDIKRIKQLQATHRKMEEMVDIAVEQTPDGLRRKALRTKLDDAYRRRDLRLEERTAMLEDVQTQLAELGDNAAADTVAEAVARLKEVEAKGMLRNRNGGSWWHGTIVQQIDPFDPVIGARTQSDNYAALWFFDNSADARDWSLDRGLETMTSNEARTVAVEIQANNPKVYAAHPDDVFPHRTWSDWGPQDDSLAGLGDEVDTYQPIMDDTGDVANESLVDKMKRKGPVDRDALDAERLAMVEYQEGVPQFGFSKAEMATDMLKAGVDDGTVDLREVAAKLADTNGFSQHEYSIELLRELADDFDVAKELYPKATAWDIDGTGADLVDLYADAMSRRGLVQEGWSPRAQALDELQRIANSGEYVGGWVRWETRAGHEILDKAAMGASYRKAMLDQGYDSILMPHGTQGWTAGALDPAALRQTGGQGGVKLKDLPGQIDTAKAAMRRDAAIIHHQRMQWAELDMNMHNGDVLNVRQDLARTEQVLKDRVVELDEAVKNGQRAKMEVLQSYIDSGTKAHQAAAEADRLAELAVTQGDQAAADMAASLRVGAQADAARARMFSAEDDLVKIDKAIENAMRYGGFKDQFVEVLKSGMAPLSNNTQTHAGLAEAIRDVSKVIAPEDVGPLLKTFDYFTRMFKAYAIMSPGFHMRNSFGGYFNNFIAGVKPQSYAQFRYADGIYRRALKQGLSREKALAEVQNAVGSGLKMGPNGKVPHLGSGAGKKFTQEYADAFAAVERSEMLGRVHAPFEGGRRAPGVSTKRTRLGGVHDVADEIKLTGQSVKKRGLLDKAVDNPATRAGRVATHEVERTLRGAHAVDVIANKGGTIDDALDSVLTYHFDYDDLSKFEKNVMRRIVPFYTWTRKNLPLQIEAVLTKPKAYSRIATIKRNIEKGESEDGIVPQWMLEEGGFQLPFGDDLWVVPDLPIKDLNNLNDPRRALSNLNPLVKLPVEITTNKQLWNDRPFREGYVGVPLTHQALGIGTALEAVGMARRDKDGNLVTRDSFLYAIDQFMPLIGRSRRMVPSEQKYQDRLATTWINFAFGLGLRTNTAAEQTGELKRRAGKVDALAEDMESLGYGGYYQYTSDVPIKRGGR